MWRHQPIGPFILRFRAAHFGALLLHNAVHLSSDRLISRFQPPLISPPWHLQGSDGPCRTDSLAPAGGPIINPTRLRVTERLCPRETQLLVEPLVHSTASASASYCSLLFDSTQPFPFPLSPQPRLKIKKRREKIHRPPSLEGSPATPCRPASDELPVFAARGCSAGLLAEGPAVQVRKPDLGIAVGFVVLGSVGMGPSWWWRPLVLWLLASVVAGEEVAVAAGKAAPRRHAYAAMMYMGTPRDYEFYVATRVMMRSLGRLRAAADRVVIASLDVPPSWVQAL
jgi:hypothetical protein